MADLAFTHHQDFGFDNSGNFTTAAFDTTGDTWLVVYAYSLSNPINGLTAISYNGVSFFANRVVNTATAHISANAFGIAYMNLGANAGNHTFNFQWTGGGFIGFVGISGNGDLDAATVDGTPVPDAAETVSTGSIVTPPPYTPTTNKALPIIAVYANSQVGTTSANANCTVGQLVGVAGLGLFYAPLSTPAGTPTSAVINTNLTDFWQFISFAIKPAGGSSAPTTPYFARLLGNGSSL